MKVMKTIKITKYLELVKWDNGKHYFRWHGSDLFKWKDFVEEFKYRKRVYKHKIVKKVFEFTVKRMAMYLLNQVKKKATSEDYIHKEPKIVYSPSPVNFYHSCKSPNKKWCHGGSMHWYLNFREYFICAHTEYGLYLEIIRIFIIEAMSFPFCG